MTKAGKGRPDPKKRIGRGQKGRGISDRDRARNKERVMKDFTIKNSGMTFEKFKKLMDRLNATK